MSPVTSTRAGRARFTASITASSWRSGSPVRARALGSAWRWQSEIWTRRIRAAFSSRQLGQVERMAVGQTMIQPFAEEAVELQLLVGLMHARIGVAIATVEMA